MREGATARPVGVLLVDDDLAVRDSLTRWLRGHGFLVWPAPGGAAALELLGSHAAEIDLALIDLRMPGMDGFATLAALRAAAPGLVCCLMGGFVNDAEERLLAAGAAAVFDKPLRLRDLAQTLRGLLSGRQSQPDPMQGLQAGA
jgi:CheY-like chemotaxis protein